jgi:DNA-binding transcriptional LysR family regulator
MLDNIRSFAKAVEHGSFSEAGRRMRVSPNVISHRIQTLEAHLGCRLFNRTTRRISLTEQGRAFHDTVIEALELIANAEANLSELGAMPRGTVRVGAPLSLGRRLVAGVASLYLDRHPQIDVQLRLSEHRLDIIAESVDLALQLASFADSSLIMRKIADAERILCAAPSYLDAAPKLRAPADLARHQCLLLRYPGTPDYRWTLLRDGEEINVSIAGRLDADDGDVLTHWALEGRGIVMKPVFEIADALAQGRLVPVLPATPPPAATLAVLYPARRLVPPKVKSFGDLLVEEGRKHLTRELAKLDRKAPG